MKRKLIVFASGTASGGGSGFENLVRKVKKAKVVGVVSNHENGGVRKGADRLGVPFRYFPSPWNASGYHRFVEEFGADFVALSGWLRYVYGLDPRTTFNIHPGPLPAFGGKKMYGLNVHKAVLKAFHARKVPYSAVTMHFVTEVGYDMGPIFFQKSVAIYPEDTAKTLALRVNRMEHLWQPCITDLVVTGQISWDGVNASSLVVPDDYDHLYLCTPQA